MPIAKLPDSQLFYRVDDYADRWASHDKRVRGFTFMDRPPARGDRRVLIILRSDATPDTVTYRKLTYIMDF